MASIIILFMINTSSAYAAAAAGVTSFFVHYSPEQKKVITDKDKLLKEFRKITQFSARKNVRKY